MAVNENFSRRNSRKIFAVFREPARRFPLFNVEMKYYREDASSFPWKAIRATKCEICNSGTCVVVRHMQASNYVLANILLHTVDDPRECLRINIRSDSNSQGERKFGGEREREREIDLGTREKSFKLSARK